MSSSLLSSGQSVLSHEQRMIEEASEGELVEAVKQLTHQQQQQKAVTAAAPNELRMMEEKKEDDVTGRTPIRDESLATEEGQEALWVEEEVNVSPASSKGSKGSPGRGSPRGLRFLGKPKKTAAPATTKQTHVLLLPHNNNNESKLPSVDASKTTPPTAGEVNKTREAADKAAAARKMLDQALAPETNVGSRELLARAAFGQATEARELLESRMTPELSTLIQDAKRKGQAEITKIRDLQLKEPTDTGEAPPSPVMEELSGRARQFFEFVLPETMDASAVLVPASTNDSAAASSPEPIQSSDTISTLGFDNTFEEDHAANKKDMDVLSMSSLNDILDGPLDESPITHRIIADIPEGANEDDSTAAVEEPEKRGFFGRLRKKSTPEKPTSRYSPDPKKQATTNEKSTPDRKKTATAAGVAAAAVAAKARTPEKRPLTASKKATPENQKASSAKKASPNRKQTAPAKTTTKSPARRRIWGGKKKETLRGPIATVVESDPNEVEEEELATDLPQVKGVDKKLQKQLQEAMQSEDARSISSADGVPIHSRYQAGRLGGSKSQRTPPRNLEKAKPQFVAAPQGDPSILIQNSWDSLSEHDAIPSPPPRKAPAAARTAAEELDHHLMCRSEETEEPSSPARPSGLDLDQTPVPPSPASRAAYELDQIISPASTSESTNDKYTMASGDSQSADDKYTIAEDDVSFEAFINSCAPEGIKLIGPGSMFEAIVFPASGEGESTTVRTLLTEDKYGGDTFSTNGSEMPPVPAAHGYPEDSRSPAGGTTIVNDHVQNMTIEPERAVVAPQKSPQGKKPRFLGLFGKRKGPTASAPKKPKTTPPKKTPPKTVTTKTAPTKKKTSKAAVPKKATPTRTMADKTNQVTKTKMPQKDPVVKQQQQQQQVTVVAPGSSSTDTASTTDSLNPLKVTAEFEIEADPLLSHIQSQRNRHRRGLDPVTGREDREELRGIDP